jgi:hypothetical protein
VALAGAGGLASVKSDLDRVFTDNVRASQLSTSLGANLSRADDWAGNNPSIRQTREAEVTRA